MLWFRPYRFRYAGPAHRVQATLASSLSQQGFQCTQADHVLKITRPPGPLFRNSWNPLFVARLSSEGGHTVLRGHFRVHAVVMVFMALFLAMLLWRLWTAYQLPEMQAGYEPGWRDFSIRFEWQFLGMFAVVVVVGWLMGLPNARRILDALRAGAAPAASAPSAP